MQKVVFISLKFCVEIFVLLVIVVVINKAAKH